MKRSLPARPPILTLLTDFGIEDEYVAVLKGVILRHCRTAQIIDLSHLVPPQAVATAMLLLSRAFRHFPEKTVHLAVVDPEVGTDRAILAVDAYDHFFIGPDNGLFTPLLAKESGVSVYRLDQQTLPGNRVSATFHGRDIMAPVAARVAGGAPLSEFGTPVSIAECRKLDHVFPRKIGKTLEGRVVHIDHFGNLGSNLHRHDLLSLAPLEQLQVLVNQHNIPLRTTYAAVAVGQAVALFDSNDYLEIACYRGDGASQLGLGLGTPITVLTTSTREALGQQRKI